MAMQRERGGAATTATSEARGIPSDAARPVQLFILPPPFTFQMGFGCYSPTVSFFLSSTVFCFQPCVQRMLWRNSCHHCGHFYFPLLSLPFLSIEDLQNSLDWGNTNLGKRPWGQVCGVNLLRQVRRVLVVDYPNRVVTVNGKATVWLPSPSTCVARGACHC